MPVYVYRNLNTNETFEIEQRITEAALTHHPETGDPVKRLIQPVGIAFKGSGFYVTDSRGKKATKTDSSKADSSKADSSKADSSKTDSSQTSAAETGASSKTDGGDSSKKDTKKETSSSKPTTNNAS
jgi:predicted nucleic acid-binding Zn ribbon protein